MFNMFVKSLHKRVISHAEATPLPLGILIRLYSDARLFKFFYVSRKQNPGGGAEVSPPIVAEWPIM